jgi:hypothetical protein
VFDRVVRSPRYSLLGVGALVVVSGLAGVAHGLMRRSDPLPAVEQCDCIIDQGRGSRMHGRRDVHGECKPTPCRICPDGRGVAPSSLTGAERHGR